MIELSLQPQDFLFFKDSRPMLGSSPGRGAQLPMQHVLNGALHSALHRAFPEQGSLEGEKIHTSEDGSFRFGNLTSVGPFLSNSDSDNWYFPTPLDLCTKSGELSHFPLSRNGGISSLPSPLAHPVISRFPPTKENRQAFLNEAGFTKYLSGLRVDPTEFAGFEDFFSPEHAVGIAIDNDRNSVEKGMIYTSERMRLREQARLVAYASFHLKGREALNELFTDNNRILVGGESRICSVESKPVTTLRLPNTPKISGTRIKFVLLTPAIFVAVPDHNGGWLPNWVSPKDGSFRLLDGPGPDKVKRLRKKFPDIKAGAPIEARLVSAHIGKPEIVSGWAQGKRGGAKSTLLAVPAGSVYYFEASSEEQAQKLVSALNWNSNKNSDSPSINRRSALMGEKGYGIGVCAPWQFLEDNNSK
jgi:CRISPR-associated protein Cmr3